MIEQTAIKYLNEKGELIKPEGVLRGPMTPSKLERHSEFHNDLISRYYDLKHAVEHDAIRNNKFIIRAKSRMMDQIAPFLFLCVTLIGILTLSYLALSFITLEANPVLWEDLYRFIFIGFSVLFLSACVGLAAKA